MSPETVIGWDIGGAHVKAAVLRGPELLEVSQYPCPLWLGLSRLEEVIDRVLTRFEHHRLHHAVTMTGELADCFSGRDEGVGRILEALESRIDPNFLYVFAGASGLIDFESVKSENFPKIASANWLASAMYVAKQVDNALFVDIGSTTTDVLLIEGGKVKSQGFSDYERLVSAEMLYRGIVRTPVAALAQQVPFEGRTVPLMAEFFATTADIYRLTGNLPEEYDQWPAADGAEKTIEASARRLARMIGRDVESAPFDSWTRLACALKETQVREIQDAMMQQLSRLHSDGSPLLVGAGVGRFLAAETAPRIGLRYRDFSALVKSTVKPTGIPECAPAVSLSLLLAESLGVRADFRTA